jgi:hypothetical protein
MFTSSGVSSVFKPLLFLGDDRKKNVFLCYNIYLDKAFVETEGTWIYVYGTADVCDCDVR